MHFRISSISRNVYQPNDAAATEIGSNRKAPCLGYTPRAGEVPSLTQRYGPESLSQHMVHASIVMKQDHFTTSLASKWPLFF
ncbi:hypothetical protein P5V15_007824 [Pogonomyrmex californicus]